MNIIYMGKHGQLNNDDEGAIAYALGELGHNVKCLPERKGRKTVYLQDEYDMLLMHNWGVFETLHELRIPKVFWYFDLVHQPDTEFRNRNLQRTRWVDKVTKLTDIGFCTDGDWASKSDKLHWLPQGADERIIGFGKSEGIFRDVLFAGIRTGGAKRLRCLSALANRYGENFHVLEKRDRVYREAFAQEIAQSKCVIAPAGPVTHRYWSNRVYLVCGFGGCLAHPSCNELLEHYTDDVEVAFYRSEEEMFDKLDFYIRNKTARRIMKENAINRTLRHHTYRHRCQELISTVQQELGL